MPPTKAVLANLAKGRAAKAEKQTQLSSESAIDDLWSSLQAANWHITELENELAEKNAEFNKLQAKLEKSTQQCSQLATDLSLWKSKHKLIYHDLRMQRQTSKCGQDKIASLNEQVDLLKKAEANASASLLKNSQNAQLAIESLTKANMRSLLSPLIPHGIHLEYASFHVDSIWNPPLYMEYVLAEIPLILGSPFHLESIWNGDGMAKFHME